LGRVVGNAYNWQLPSRRPWTGVVADRMAAGVLARTVAGAQHRPHAMTAATLGKDVPKVLPHDYELVEEGELFDLLGSLQWSGNATQCRACASAPFKSLSMDVAENQLRAR